MSVIFKRLVAGFTPFLAHYWYYNITKFEDTILVEKKYIDNNSKLSFLIGDRYIIEAVYRSLKFNPRRVLWDNRVLNAGGHFESLKTHELYKIEGYGLWYPKLGIYPNISNFEKFDDLIYQDLDMY